MAELTREQVLAMEAGEDLDCLIAERVLGWTGCFEGLRAVREADPSQEWAAEILTGLPPLGFMYRSVPRYSTGMASAWEVVEHLLGSECEFGLSAYRSPIRSFTCRLYAEGDTYFVVNAPAMPLAICRAALLLTLTEAA